MEAANIPSKGPIKVGFLTTLTGTAAPGGKQMVRTLTAFLEQFDFRIAGRKVELVVEDDRHHGARAINEAHRLVEQEKIHLLAGTITSNVAYALAPAIDMLKIPAVFPLTGADDLTKRKRCQWAVRTSFACSQIGLPFGKWVYDKLGYRRVVTVALDYSYGWDLVGSFRKTFEECGGEIVQRIWIPQLAGNVYARMREIRKDADAVFVATANLGADVVASQYKAFGPGLPVIAGGPSYDETVLASIEDAGLGAISACHYSGALDTPANHQFKDMIRARCGDEVCASTFSEGAYTFGMWLKNAIELVQGEVEDRQRLLDALKRVQLFDAPRGSITLDAYANPIQNIYIRKVEKVNGKLQNTVIETIPNVSQFWTYDPEKFMADPPFGPESVEPSAV
jgi:branched-chain amino acid transport system substrate-binding protein